MDSDHDAPQHARDPRLAIVSEAPLNAETMLARHMGVITPNAAFYVRNHFAVPDCEIAEWRLTIAGAVETPVELTYEELRALPSRTLQVTLECAGNGRVAMRPQAEGEPWGYGAASTAEWTGVPYGPFWSRQDCRLRRMRSWSREPIAATWLRRTG